MMMMMMDTLDISNKQIKLEMFKGILRKQNFKAHIVETASG